MDFFLTVHAFDFVDPWKCLGFPREFLDHTLRTTVLVIASVKQNTIWSKSVILWLKIMNPTLIEFMMLRLYIFQLTWVCNPTVPLTNSLTKIFYALLSMPVMQIHECVVFHFQRDHVKFSVPSFLFAGHSILIEPHRKWKLAQHNI